MYSRTGRGEFFGIIRSRRRIVAVAAGAGAALFRGPGFRPGILGDGFAVFFLVAVGIGLRRCLRRRIVLALLAGGCLALLTFLLALLRGLRHRVEDAEVMFSMLKICFRHDAVAGSAGIAAKLEIFFKKLLCCSPHAQVGSVTVKDMITVQRYLTVIMA